MLEAVPLVEVEFEEDAAGASPEPDSEFKTASS